MHNKGQTFSEYFSVRRDGRRAVVTFHVRTLLDSGDIINSSHDLHALIEQHGIQDIVLDMREIRFLSSRALGLLINLKHKAEEVGGRLLLCALAPEANRVFRITRLDKLFQFYETPEQALEALQKDSPDEQQD